MGSKKYKKDVVEKSPRYILKRLNNSWLKTIGTKKGSYLFTFDAKSALDISEEEAIKLSELISDCKYIKI